MKLDQKGESGIISIIALIIVILGCVWGYNHLIKPDKWSLMYENDFGAIVVAGDYNSREVCSQKLDIARLNPGMHRPECGSNCKQPSIAGGPYICEATFEL
jgi:hypothetical protein